MLLKILGPAAEGSSCRNRGPLDGSLVSNSWILAKQNVCKVQAHKNNMEAPSLVSAICSNVSYSAPMLFGTG